MITRGLGKAKDLFTDVKVRKLVKEWRAVRVKDKTAQTVLSSSDTVILANAIVTMDLSVKGLGRKKEDWQAHKLANPESLFF